MADKIKIALAFILFFVGVAAFYYFGEQSLLLRVLGLLAATGVSIGIISQTAPGRRVWGFVGEAKLEAAKVVWPTGKETKQTTLIVMALTIIVALFLWGFDSFLMWTVQSLTGRGV
ncbi:MAG: preprotein translocase subunit SecE [Gammaproteobacteria bacterium]|nr:preprotein translocase subunit SecE [Gammaproteobacteria bacterium]